MLEYILSVSMCCCMFVCTLSCMYVPVTVVCSYIYVHVLNCGMLVDGPLLCFPQDNPVDSHVLPSITVEISNVCFHDN